MTIPALAQSHKGLVAGVVALAGRVQADRQLAALVRRKFAIKCTTGYSLNALVDFPLSDPIEIIKRLLIGSEGTLGFVSQGTYNTVPEWPHKARAFVCWVGEVAASLPAVCLECGDYSPAHQSTGSWKGFISQDTHNTVCLSGRTSRAWRVESQRGVCGSDNGFKRQKPLLKVARSSCSV